ncbi:zinc ribbon domain-containing protein [Halobiforma lacisalsi AJ5]|uniref:Zinc ribbon domain-containing protein n=1 Tax=Natronobacterium lacisalsi AJ5 TaxID=358396 RepID=M0LG71_NATLA|nr:zinc ribbon domain-containing protein [Halobiforma lacisalsi]APW98740.1 zinc ribbon domain-containing protein [Halobiforma lacisalsi AJ5]EMA32612.1 hypothetical protein C445_10862 [Halobiforma lacisalsi AJ5]
MSGDEPVAPEAVPDPLVERLVALDVPELRAVRTYVERLLDYARPPLTDRIRAEASGELLEIDDHGGSALVRKRPPNQEESDADPGIVSLYRVTRERHIGGEETLHWSFLGDVRNPTLTDCDHCGGSVDEHAETCPHCGSELPDSNREGER